MRRWWVGFLVVLQAAALAAASPPDALLASSVSSELSAALTRDYEIEVLVAPHRGDAWSRLARRVTGDGARWPELARFNGSGETLSTDRPVRVPFSSLRPELRKQVMTILFPGDRQSGEGWRHTVVGSGLEGESLWKIAEWFTGDGTNYTAVRKVNPGQGLSTHSGDVILVPKELLTAAFRGRDEMEGENASSATTEIRQPPHDQAQRPSENEDAPQAAVVEAVATGQPSLTYERGADGSYAIYKLQKGEALYSSVAIRFTGRVYAKDVGDVLDRIVRFNGITDVAKIHVGRPIRIPMELLLPEYRPADDPARVAAEESKRASTQMARRTRARNLTGVTVIIDAGHGGRDGGAVHGQVSEARYVYDVACRLKKVLESRSGARVVMTTKSKSTGFSIVDGDHLAPQNDHVVLTTPGYPLGDSVVGVNLRWYLANSVFGRAIKSGTPKEKTIFISIHADSLHPSLRGAMAYIPGERYVQGSFRKTAGVYLARAEVRERPQVTHSERESLEAEGLSRELAESIVEHLEVDGLKVHPFNAVRDNVVRDGREWVPAIIRYNLVPTRVLIEICNLGNQRDRELMTTRRWRESVADAVYGGIASFFGVRSDDEPGLRVADRAAR